jgi:hypothetical protein
LPFDNYGTPAIALSRPVGHLPFCGKLAEYQRMQQQTPQDFIAPGRNNVLVGFGRR